ncbi:hypothetical protein EPUL_006570 [Erysiphe pulchra]|uniref:Uncharacterized protein n=1 Tax=Erysiphe pulchra TaxID=225359 RepID=A0A2S4PKN6_9PEZI|nr:hypothetical protein EPUL_006570 [Erysiphe pulchra]
MTDSMDLSHENQALSTDTSNKPPPIPPIPPIPNSLPPIAPPTPPSNSQLLNCTTSSRKILKPAIPIKRPIPERPQENNKTRSDVVNAFLPRELAEIVATRQRRERAWHTRIMICTTVYSNIESTLANFSDEFEKEEVVAFKAYLRQAIANFAAVDNSPNPPKIPSHSKPTKGSGSGSGKGKNLEKNVPVAIPQISRPPQTSQNSWVTVARNGQKKARVTPSINTHITPMSKIRSRESNKEKSLATSTDKRLFLRLPQEHEWRKFSPAGIREVVVKKLSISPTLIGRIKPVHSGFALSPCSTEAREKILNAGNGLFLTGAKLEAATNWATVLIPTVPAFIRKEQGKVEVSNSMLADEVERVCSMRPAHLKLYGRNKAEAPHRTWMAFFPKAPSSSFKVFDESGIARSFKKQQPLEFCKRCNGHHSIKNCSRAPSCGNCGSTNHTEDLCMATTKCRNCGGPHRSDSRRCLARPTRSGAPTKEQLKTYRIAGEREFQALLRAKVAEESAITANTSNSNVIGSQVTDLDSNIEISQASSVGKSSDGAIRL